jgi:hypothetical protein
MIDVKETSIKMRWFGKASQTNLRFVTRLKSMLSPLLRACKELIILLSLMQSGRDSYKWKFPLYI